MVNAARTIKLAGNIDIAGNLTTSGAFATTLTVTGTTTLTLPTTGTVTALGNTTTGSGSIVLATSPSINGGTHTGITTLSIRDTSAAYDVQISATSSTTLTNSRSITFDVVNAARTIKLGGNLTIAGAFTTAGAFATTLTVTGTTTLTLPTTGTVTALGNTTTGSGSIVLATSPSITNLTLTGTLTAGGSVGTNGYYLQTTGTGVQWQPISAGITITDDSATSTSTNYLTFTTATSGTISTAKVTSTKLYFQPSTGTLSSTIFTATSDVRFKTDLEKIKGALSKVKQLTGYTFTMIDSGQRSAGLLAQDVKPVSPESIGGTEDKMTLNYDSLLGLIVESIKEIDDKLTVIEQRLDK